MKKPINKLNQRGFAHWVLPLLVIVVIAAIGTYVLTGSHADELTKPTSAPVSSTTFSNRYLSISPTQGAVAFQHGTPPNIGILPPGSQFSPADLFAVGFTINNKSAIAYKLTQFTGGSNGGFYNPTGNLQPNQPTKVIVFVNSDTTTNGTHPFTAQLDYEIPTNNPAKPQRWVNKEVSINLQATLSGDPYLDYIKVQSPTNITETLSRSKVNSNSGLIFGQNLYVTALNRLTGFEVVPNQPTQGQGFYTSSGGLAPGQTAALQTYINPNKANGVYSGSDVIKYQNSQQQWLNGPTVNYTINLVN
jgi:hypothetical protein